ELTYALADSGARACLVAAASASTVQPLRATPQAHSVDRWIWLDQRPDRGAYPEAAGDATVDELTDGAPEDEPSVVGGPIAETDPKPDAVLEAMERHRVTAMMAVPTVWRRLVEHPDLDGRDLSAFKRAMGSSDAMPLDLLDQVVQRFGATWTQTYGLTEAGCIL